MESVVIRPVEMYSDEEFIALVKELEVLPTLEEKVQFL
jgi:hypothetical protein